MDEYEEDKRNQYLQFRELLREYKKNKRFVIWETSIDIRYDIKELGKDLADRIKKFKSKERK